MPLFVLVMSVVTAVAAPEADSRRPVIAAPLYRLLMAPDRNVRSLDRRVSDALAVGVRRSATFARLLAALDGSDVIAYIELSHDLPTTTQGRLVLATKSLTHRYVRIQVRAMQAPDEVIAIIGHELQHALEIAGAPGVRDSTTMRQHYERVGAGRSHSLGFETREAQDAGRRVRLELRQTA